MSTQRTSETVVHASVVVDVFWDCGSHQQLDGEKLGLFPESVLGWVEAEQSLPFPNIAFVVVGLDPSASDPDGMAVGDFGVGKGVTISGHDSSNGAANVLVGGIGKGSQVGLDGEGRNNAVNIEKKENLG